MLDSDIVVPPIDEYDSYLLQVADMLLNGCSRQAAIEYLDGIAFKCMGLESPEYDMESSSKVVELIVKVQNSVQRS